MLQDLISSGRWTECSVPVGKEGTLITVACFYGISGAGSDKQRARANEKLLAACLARALAAGDTPYFLLLDTNIPIPQSHSLSQAIGHCKLIDVVADRWHNDDPPPTYLKGGIREPIPTGTPNSSRIDLVLTNAAGHALIDDVSLRWDLAWKDNLDHVPIDVVLKEEPTDFTIDQVLPVEPIDLRKIVKPTEGDGNRLYHLLLQHPVHRGKLEEIIGKKDSDGAHLEWSRAATNYLLTLEYLAEFGYSIKDSSDEFLGNIIDSVIHRRRDKATTERGSLRKTQAVPVTSRIAKGTILSLNSIAKMVSKFRARCRSLASIVRVFGANAYERLDYVSLTAKISKKAHKVVDQTIQDGDLRDPQRITALADAAEGLLREIQSDRQKDRVETWWNRLYLGWRQEGAKSFYRALKCENLNPRASFPDPKNNHKHTADPRRIAQLFRDEWEQHVYKRDENLPADLWPGFKESYGNFIDKIPEIPKGPLTAVELQNQVNRMWAGGAPSLDGWRPSETRLLPFMAWQERRHVEHLFTRTGCLPAVYHQVPVSMLRKKDGMTPLQHRGISVFAVHYRIAGCAWWHRVMPAFQRWVHPAASGGLPGRECMEAAWDAQIAIEFAFLERSKVSAILMDYEKFFDTFDCDFFAQLFKEVGMPEEIATLFSSMYAGIQRRLKISGHLDSPLTSSCGAGQGDSFSLLAALIIVSIEFRMLDARWPKVLKGSVVDDRNLVGTAADVIGATRDCMAFDKKAGLRNNLPKFLGMANNLEDRQLLASTIFDGHPLKVTDETALVGFGLTTKRAVHRKRQDERCYRAIDTAHRVTGLKPPDPLRNIAVQAAVLPAACYGNIWAFPSAGVLGRLGTATIQVIYGHRHGLRCPELISTLFIDPIRACPLAAIVYRNLMDIRRLLCKNATRREAFCINLELAQECDLDNVNGPAHGLLSLASAIGCRVELAKNGNDVSLVSDDAGRSISLLSSNTPLVKWNLRDFATRQILNQLQQRIMPDQDGKYGRKDLVGITSVIDRHATLALSSSPSGCGVDSHRTRFALRIILSGAPMYGDRLAAAKLIPDDTCCHPHCQGARCTAEHWLYECPRNQNNIDQFRKDFNSVRDKAVRVRPSNGATLDRLILLPCLRLCGICPHPDTQMPQFSWNDEYEKDLQHLHQRLGEIGNSADFETLNLLRWQTVNGKEYVKCYTDGSCLYPTDPYLAIGGWALFFHNGCMKNSSAPLRTPVQSSYAAELRAIAEAIVSATRPLIVYCDCQSIVKQLNRFLATGDRAGDHELAPELWDFVYLALENALPKGWILFQWIPGHLDSSSKKTKRENMLASGDILIEDIQGNVEADHMADAAAKRHAFPVDMHSQADHRRDLTVVTQRHLVRSWLLWCDLTREARDDLKFLGEPSLLLQDEFSDAFSDAKGQFIDDWADSELLEDPFSHLQPQNTDFDDPLEGDLLGSIDMDGNELPSYGSINSPGPTQTVTLLDSVPQSDYVLRSTVAGTSIEPGISLASSPTSLPSPTVHLPEFTVDATVTQAEGVRGGMGLPADEVPTETPSVGASHARSPSDGCLTYDLSANITDKVASPGSLAPAPSSTPPVQPLSPSELRAQQACGRVFNGTLAEIAGQLRQTFPFYSWNIKSLPTFTLSFRKEISWKNGTALKQGFTYGEADAVRWWLG